METRWKILNTKTRVLHCCAGYQDQDPPVPVRLLKPLSRDSEDLQVSPTLDPTYLNPKNDILWQFYWYWGPVPRLETERRLVNAPDGSFIVRDDMSNICESSKAVFIRDAQSNGFVITFRSMGKTFHGRITKNEHPCHCSVKEHIENAMQISKTSVYCWFDHPNIRKPSVACRLLNPLSRYSEARSLKDLSRFVIRRFWKISDIEKLVLPKVLIKYLLDPANDK